MRFTKKETTKDGNTEGENNLSPKEILKQLEDKLEDLMGQKHKMFIALKQILHDDEKKKQEELAGNFSCCFFHNRKKKEEEN